MEVETVTADTDQTDSSGRRQVGIATEVKGQCVVGFADGHACDGVLEFFLGDTPCNFVLSVHIINVSRRMNKT